MASLGQVSRDSKHRVLFRGESQRADGKYIFKYQVNNKVHILSSWRLVPTDKQPQGTKPTLSLRELEKLHGQDMESRLDPLTRNMTVKECVAMAVEDDLLRKNPFDFELAKVLINDAVKRDALTAKQERDFLKFIKEDEYFSQFYDGIFMLLKTGLRISELCGLTVRDIDLQERTINVQKQLQYTGGKKAYIEQQTKTTAGTKGIANERRGV